MIQVEGIAYTIDKDGDAEPAEKDESLPFVMVTTFQPTQRVKTPPRTTKDKVQDVFKRGKNTPMPFRISGMFKYINTQQATLWDVKGTIFGYCIPVWQKDVSGDGKDEEQEKRDREYEERMEEEYAKREGGA